MTMEDRVETLKARHARLEHEIDDEVHRLISEGYDVSRNILTRRHDQLERIAHELIQKETLDRTELDQLLTESPGNESKEEKEASCTPAGI